MPKTVSQAKKNSGKKQQPKSPSISRAIAEHPVFLSLKQRRIFWLHFTTGFLLVAIVIVSVDVYHVMQRRDEAFAVKKRVEIERNYWQKVMQTYTNYRDGYYRLAVLEYVLGNKESAQKNLVTAFALDPNFTAGKALEEKLGREE